MEFWRQWSILAHKSVFKKCFLRFGLFKNWLSNWTSKKQKSTASWPLSSKTPLFNECHTNLYFTLAKWGILTKITTQFLTMLNCQMFHHFVSGFKFFLALLAKEMFLVIMFFQMRPIFHDLKTMLALVRVYGFGCHIFTTRSWKVTKKFSTKFKFDFLFTF